MTLVELMAAILILAIVLAALASTLITTSSAIVRSERTTEAAQVASSVIEELQALEWDSLGHTSADLTAAGWASDFEGEPHVVTAPSAGSSASPVEVISRDGIDYTVERHVTWSNDGAAVVGANQNGDFKRLTTLVTYDVYGDTRTYRLQATRAPAPTNALRNFAVDTFAVAPDAIEYSTAGVPSDSTLDVTAVFSMPADTAPTLTWSDDGGTTEHVAAPMTSVDGGYTWSALVSTVDATGPTPRRFENDGAVLFTVRGSHQSTLNAQAEFTVEVREEGAPPVIYVDSLSMRQYSVKNNGTIDEITPPICLKNGAPAKPVVVEAEVRGLGSVDEGRVGISWKDTANAVYPVSATDPKGYQVLTTTFDRQNAAGDGSIFRLTITNVDNSYGFTDGRTIGFRVHIDEDDDGIFTATETIWDAPGTASIYQNNGC